MTDAPVQPTLVELAGSRLIALLLALLASYAVAQQSTPTHAGAAAPQAFRLSLAAALQMQQETSRVIRAAARQAEIAAAEVHRANVRPNPVVSAQIGNSEPNRYRPAGIDRLLRIDQVFERGGKRELRTRVAQSLEQASKWELADSARQQRQALAEAFFELVAAQELYRLGNQTVADYQRLLAASERRSNAGDLAPIDVSRLKVESDRARNEYRQLGSQLELARVGLAAVIGQESIASQLIAAGELPGGAEVDDAVRSVSQSSALRGEGSRDNQRDSSRADRVDGSRDDRGDDRLDGWLDRRADLLAAASRVDAAQRAVDLARSQRERDVSIGLQTERPAQMGGHVFGISASVPLLVNNDYSADIARAQAELEAARDDLARQRAQARSEHERAKSRLRSAADRLQRTRATTLPEAVRVSEAIEYAFSRGAVPLTDLFDTRRQLLAVRNDLISAQLDFAKSRAAYEAVTSLEALP